MARPLKRKTHYIVRRDQEIAAGKLKKHNLPWTNEDMDDLLDGYLADRLCIVSKPGADSLEQRCQRYIEGIETRLRRLCAYVKDHNRIGPYTPTGKRRDRTGLPLTHRDKCCLDRLLSEDGRKLGYHRPAYVGKILGRDPKEVEKIIDRLAAQVPVLLTDPKAGEDSATHRARLAHEAVKGMFDKMWAAQGAR